MIDPDILWHYTSVEAFESIISSRIFRATHIARLNDSDEFTLGQSYALARTQQTLAEIAADPTKSDCNEMFALISARMAAVKPADLPLFLISLSDEGDLPYQWCNYTPRGQGVSIGFDRATLFNRQHNHSPVFHLRNCEYDPDQQLSGVMNVFHHHIVRRVLKLRNGSLATESERVDYAFNESKVELGLSMARMKKADPYRNEQEHRLIAIVEPSDSIVRHWPDDGRPYVEYKFAFDGENLPVSAVYIGPAADPDVRPKVQEIMSKHGLDGAWEIKDSAVCPEDHDCCDGW